MANPAPTPAPTPTPPPPKPPTTDDFGDTPATATPISTNAAFSGKIETKGDTDWFKLTLTAGTTYGFGISGGSVGGMSALSSPHLYLRDASGAIVADASPVSINAGFQFAVKTGGTYYLEAASHANQGIGGYGLAVSTLGVTPAPPPPPETPQPVRLDLDSVEPVKAENDESMTYRIDYTGDLTGDVVINWEVHGSGSHPADATDFVRTSGSVTLHKGQDYAYIHVTPQGDQVDEYDETFTLTISVAGGGVSIRDGNASGTILNDDGGRILPDHDELNDSFQTATQIVEETWNRGFINTPGDTDYFAVTLTAGATYDLIVLGDDDTSLIGGDEDGFVKLLDPQAALYDSNFHQITGSFTAPVNSTRISYQFTPSVTGTYYIVTREDGNNDVGQYFVKADVRVPADDYAATTATTGHLAAGVVQMANNERDGDSDWFAVDLTAGQSYSFYAVDRDSAQFDGQGYIWPGWTDDLQVALRDAQGNVVATGAVVPGWQPAEVIAQIGFSAVQSGRYYLSVSGAVSSDRYLVGYDRVANAPGTGLTTLQPGPSAGTDVTFSNVRDHQGAAGTDGAVLSVGGLWSSGSSASALRFDLASLPHDASYAAIQLYYTGAIGESANSAVPMPMLLGTPMADWDEQSSLGQLDGYHFEKVLTAPTAPGWYTIDITDIYNQWQDGSRDNTGIILLSMDMFAATAQFDSSDFADAAFRPRLIVDEREPNEIRGTNAFDILSGDGHANQMFGLDGDDLIVGEGGDDWIDGGAGADMIDGGDGYDSVSYRNSPEAVAVDLGVNQSRGGWADRDSLSNVERVEGSAFGDHLVGSQFVETLIGGDGDDVLEGGGGADTVFGGAGADLLDGGSDRDSLYGGAGNDSYFVDRQDDLVFENANEGTDTVTSTASYYLYANIENLTLAAGAGDIFGVGNELANTITGNEGGNTLLAGAGNDLVHGGAGVDIVYGEDGADQLFGDADNDVIVGGAGNDTIDGGTGGDLLYGEDGNDTIWGGTDFVFDQLVGGAGDDVLHGDSGLGDFDYLIGNAGNDTYYVDSYADLTFESAGEGTDTVYASTAAGSGYYLYANVENLVLAGSTFYGVGNELANRMTGSAQDNWLLGGAGNDVLNGKGGNDVLFGEAGADIFVFEQGTGGDTIADFTPGTDRIDLSSFGFTSFAQVQAGMSQTGGSTAILLSSGDFIVLQGVANAALHVGDFILSGGSAADLAAEQRAGSADESDPAVARWNLIHQFDTPRLIVSLAGPSEDTMPL